jgi:pre-rRNA-processing protein TSR1
MHRAERFRSSLQFILLPYGQLIKTLDAAKVADYTILCLSTEREVNSQGDTLLRCLQAQGFPQVVAVVSQVNLSQNSLPFVYS